MGEKKTNKEMRESKKDDENTGNTELFHNQ